MKKIRRDENENLWETRDNETHNRQKIIFKNKVFFYE